MGAGLRGAARGALDPAGGPAAGGPRRGLPRAAPTRGRLLLRLPARPGRCDAGRAGPARGGRPRRSAADPPVTPGGPLSLTRPVGPVGRACPAGPVTQAVPPARPAAAVAHPRSTPPRRTAPPSPELRNRARVSSPCSPMETRTRRSIPPIPSASVPKRGNGEAPPACHRRMRAGHRRARAPAPPRPAAAQAHDEQGRLPRGGTDPAQDSSAVTGTADGSLGALEDLHQPPPLGRRGRAGLHDDDTVADAGGVLLVMGLEAARLGRDLAVAGVLDTVLDLDHDGLVHLVGDHETADGLAVRALGGGRVHALLVENLDLLGGRGLGLGVVSHLCSSL